MVLDRVELGRNHRAFSEIREIAFVLGDQPCQSSGYRAVFGILVPVLWNTNVENNVGDKKGGGESEKSGH